MSAHTPGPWTAWDRGIGWEVHDPNGWPVNSEHKDTFKEADARLIAHAPELLEALRVALSQLESWEEKIDGEWGWCRKLPELEAAGALSEATLRARAAIAKATGVP
jgi:hypothetical protein